METAAHAGGESGDVDAGSWRAGHQHAVRSAPAEPHRIANPHSREFLTTIRRLRSAAFVRTKRRIGERRAMARERPLAAAAPKLTSSWVERVPRHRVFAD